MRFIGLIIAGILGVCYAYIGETAFQVGGTQLPPIAKFMNPYNGFWTNATPINPTNHSRKHLKSLKNKGTVVFDENMVPHVYTNNALDAMRMQGYIHASERLWQMDMLSRAAAGRLSEVLGESALEHDIRQRKIGMLYAAENALQSVKQHPTTFAYMIAYVEGVNSYIDQLTTDEYPLEYKLMNFKPRKWSQLDIMLIFKQMAYDLCYRNSDIQSSLTRQFLGKSTYDSLFNHKDYTEPVIPSQENWRNAKNTNKVEQADNIVDSLPLKKYIDPQPDEDNGSNNWAVNGKKTAASYPLLANDPHLGLNLPSIWYENHLNGDKTNVYGVSIPGIPGVIIGFNDHIAWGLTNVGQDVADWHALDWKNDSFNTYFIDSVEYNPKTRVEKIAVQGSDSVKVPILITKAGLVSFRNDKSDPRYGKAFSWISHKTQKEDEFSTFLALNTATSLEEYRDAIRPYASPAQNFVFASIDGDIALTVQGEFRDKKNEEGKFIQKITKSDHIDSSYIPDSLLAREINPDKNYVASANQRSTSADYPFYYNSPNVEHYRNRYLNKSLDTLKNITVGDMKHLQLSNYSKEAEHALNVLDDKLNTDELSQSELLKYKQLSEWNREFNAHDSIPVLYSMWMSNLMKNLWDEWDELNKRHIEYPSIYETLKTIEENQEFSLFSSRDRDISSLGEAVLMSFKEAVNSYEEFLNKNERAIWASYKGTKINHLSRIPAFSSDTLITGGHHSTLNAQKQNHGPSWRMIISLDSSGVHGIGVYPGGQSGNPGSPYYDNMIDDWVNGEYHILQNTPSPESIKNVTKKWIFEYE